MAYPLTNESDLLFSTLKIAIVSLFCCDGLINNTVCVFLDLYYNENYAGLAAEIFGLTETAHIQSDDSTVLPLPPSSDEVQLASADAATVEEEEQENEVAIQSEGSVANDASGEAQIVVDTNATDLIVSIAKQSILHALNICG